MSVDERYRGLMLGIRTLRSLLNELSAHFDGQISQTEFRNLEWNIRGVKIAKTLLPHTNIYVMVTPIKFRNFMKI